MRSESVLLALLSLPLMAQVSPVAPSESKDVVPAFDSSGAITLPAARLRVDIVYPHGKKESRELTVVYDPQNGHYLWHLAASNPNITNETGLYLNVIKAQRAVAFADSTGLVDFIFSGAPFVKAWKGHANSLDDAVSAATNEIQQGLPAFEGGGYHMDYKFLPVFGLARGFDARLPAGYNPIPSTFGCEPNRAYCPTDSNTIASVSKQGANWRLVLRNRWDEEVILDQNFDLVSMQQLTQPKQ